MPFQFKIQLKNISKPPVWRRLLVPEDFTFHQLHLLIQTAFGWMNAHLFRFSHQEYRSDFFISEKEMFDDPDFYEDDEVLDSKELKLSEIFNTEGQKFNYWYDFGDDWFHLITLEKITEEKLLQAMCPAGKGACPPEDCGGPWGYEGLKEALADPKHPGYKEMRKWLGLKKNETWDANFFDLKEAQEAVRDIDYDQENYFDDLI